MALSFTAKKAVVDVFNRQLSTTASIIVAEYRGISVASMTQLRVDARAQDVFVKVAKNTLVKRALADTPFAVLNDQLLGPLMYALSDDPVAAAKLMTKYGDQEPHLVVMGGALPHNLLDAKQVIALAKIPSREALLATLLGTMQAPISKTVQTMNEVPAKFARTLQAVCDAKAASH